MKLLFFILLFAPIGLMGIVHHASPYLFSYAEDDDEHEYFEEGGLNEENEIVVPQVIEETPSLENSNSIPEASADDAVSVPLAVEEPLPAVQQEDISSIPWYVTRSAAIVSYLLMFLIIVLGEGMTSGYIYNIINPVRAWVIHKYLGIAFGITLLVHMFSLLFDKFVNFRLEDILVPFHSDFQPIFLALGISGFYLLSIIILSSLLIRLNWPHLWRFIHLFVYLLFVFVFFHGIFLGTDSGSLVMKVVYLSTGIIFLIAVANRWILHLARRGK